MGEFLRLALLGHEAAGATNLPAAEEAENRDIEEDSPEAGDGVKENVGEAGAAAGDGELVDFVDCAIDGGKDDAESQHRVVGERERMEAFDEAAFLAQVEKIVVTERRVLVFYMKDGRQVTRHWTSTAKKDCWTPERRKAASEAMKARWAKRREQP